MEGDHKSKYTSNKKKTLPKIPIRTTVVAMTERRTDRQTGRVTRRKNDPYGDMGVFK